MTDTNADIRDTKMNSAIKIPAIGSFRWVALLFISVLLGNSAICDVSHGDIYYVRFDIRSKDNRIERSNLLMVPAEDEFRMVDFSSHVISGSADDAAAEEDGLLLRTRAEHNAIKLLLESHGLESVKSQSTTVNGLAHGETVVSYEGAIYLPYKRLNNHYESQSGLYSVSIEVRFAPLAFPDQWQKMKFKYKIKTVIQNLFSIF